MGVVGGNEAGMVSQMGPRRHTARTQHVQGSQSGMPVVCTYRLLSTGNVRASLHRLCLQGLGLPQVQTTPASAKQKTTKWLGFYSTRMSLDALNLNNISPSAVSLTDTYAYTSRRRPQYPGGCSM